MTACIFENDSLSIFVLSGGAANFKQKIKFVVFYSFLGKSEWKWRKI